MAFKRFSISFDRHGDMADTGVTNAFLQHVRDFKPHHRIIGGDNWDFRPLRGKASAEEKRESMKRDFDSGMEFIDAFRPTEVLLGNHCQRLWKALDSTSGPLAHLAGELVARVDEASRRSGFKLLPYCKRKGVLALGRLNVLHGFYAGGDACRKHAMIYGPCVFGHIHAYDHVSLPSYGGTREAWSAPCMCVPDMDYNEATPSTLRYDRGFVYGEYSDKSYHVEVARVIDGKVTVSTGFKQIAA